MTLDTDAKDLDIVFKISQLCDYFDEVTRLFYVRCRFIIYLTEDVAGGYTVAETILKPIRIDCPFRVLASLQAVTRGALGAANQSLERLPSSAMLLSAVAGILSKVEDKT
jgi:hypothetical protein